MSTKPNSGNFEPVAFDVEWVLAAASGHAESSDAGLAAEITDLRQVVTEAWRLMAPAQRHDLMLRDEVRQTVEGATGEWSPPNYGTQDSSQTALRWLLRVAQEHGQDEPDHETGDLQQLVRAAWPVLELKQQRDIIAGPALEAALEMLDIDLATDIQEIEVDEVEAALDHHGLDSSFRWSDQDLLDCCNARRLANRLLDLQTHTVGIDERPRNT